MEMQGTRPLAVTQQQAWDALNDPQVLKACIPGCDSIEAAGENAYAITMAIKIGPVSAKFKGNIQLADIVPPQSYTITFEGSGGPAGFGKGESRVTLTPKDSGCELGYTVNATVGGKIAQVGQRLIDGVAKSMAESFFKRFDDEMQRRHPAAAAASGDAAGAPAPAAAVPAPAAKGGVPAWVWVLIVILVVAGVYAMR
ncbi:MAG: carbon monoxide dehydrogenase subunit G [Comamonadaceae bacterium]|nr:carbon monoxide dehydrogenase subunit G [Burkholderiales bacterium]MCZ2105387.1 carbon monoxide dehydrogenase subunit G [Burkholderiales bacterium]MEB2347936.1 carbon monoxide dehydrogenase subunit G [Comamonadaceae bacterium]